MSWLNFNDSLTNLKDQFTTFASNVLADEDEGLDIAVSNNDVEKLKQICVRQELDIQNLRKVNEDLNQRILITRESKSNANGDDSWDVWEPPGETTDKNANTFSDLKQQIKVLEQEKVELTQQLEQLDVDNQQTIVGIVNIRDKLLEENEELKEKFSKIKQQCTQGREREEILKDQLRELQGKFEEHQEVKPVVDGFREKYELLLKDHHSVKFELDESKKELSVLKSAQETLQKILEDTKKANNVELEESSKILTQLEAENKILLGELQKSKKLSDELQKKSSEEDEDYKRLATILENYEKQVGALKQEIDLVEAENDKLRTKGKKTDDVQLEKDEMHKKYIGIITENVKKYVDCDKPSDFQQCHLVDDNPHLAEFSVQVENILKILLDCKYKCRALEQEVYDISQEKTKLLTEKNHEIEKLIQNSEILSQEVITKTQTIKEYEIECSELVKNNDLLIGELEEHKSNSGLQTISESNEDNMLLLESQLENANKRIEDLEKIIDELEEMKNKAGNPPEEPSKELETTMEQLSVSETEVVNKAKEYHELLNSFDVLQVENTMMKNDFKTMSERLETTSKENEVLRLDLERVKGDYENLEYQLTEICINTDAMKELVATGDRKLDLALQEKKQLQISFTDLLKTHDGMMKELEEMREKLLLEQENASKFEAQVRALTEKLQNSKMAETSLKLQYDTLNKELVAVFDAKHNLEVSLEEACQNLEKYKKEQVEYENLKADCLKYADSCGEKQQQISNLEEYILELKAKVEQYEKLAFEETAQLVQKLSLNDETDAKKMVMEVDLKPDNSQELYKQLDVVVAEKTQLQLELSETTTKLDLLQKQLDELNLSRNELINIVTTKHQESVTYHNEIQRLSQILTAETEKSQNLELQLKQLSLENLQKKDEEMEKLVDQNNFLKQKCEVLAENLLQEQANLQKVLAEKPAVSEKEQALAKKLERLQSHLMEVQEHYTQELLQAEQKNHELQAKVTETEQREKNSSTMYTSVSIRANQQVEVLQNQLQMGNSQREELMKKLSDAEDLSSKQAAALANLQFVLEQFQKEKEHDVNMETGRIRRQINVEKQVQEELKKEIEGLKQQLEESKQGLQAASRLSDQLEQSKRLVVTLKEEVSQLQKKLGEAEEKLKSLSNHTDGKVDKSLVKNLVIGFVSSNNSNNMNKDQLQILKIIATVLDFNQQDHDKVNLNKTQQQGSWWGSFLAPQDPSMSQESLSQAFVKFLESESKPRVVPSLLPMDEGNVAGSSRGATPRQSPIVLSEIVLPTFADFAQNRNSSSILKDVLKDNSHL